MGGHVPGARVRKLLWGLTGCVALPTPCRTWGRGSELGRGSGPADPVVAAQQTCAEDLGKPCQTPGPCGLINMCCFKPVRL